MTEIDSKQISRIESVIVVLQQLVDKLKSQDVIISPDMAERLAKYKRESLCLYCSKPLDEKKTTSGCHQVCYGKIRRRINAGLITLQKVVDKGWINPIAEPPGRKGDKPDPMRELLKTANPDNGARSPAAKALAKEALSETQRLESERNSGGKAKKRTKK